MGEGLFIIIGLILFICTIIYKWELGVGLAILLLCFGCYDRLESDPTWVHDRYIYSIMNTGETKGNFTLGSGSIETVEYYYYFWKSEEGFERGKKVVKDTPIVESLNGRPRVERKKVKITSKTGLIEWSPESMTEHCRIVVPQNTIVKEFKVY